MIDETLLRLDVFLRKNGHFKSRQQAREAILNGCVWVDGKPAEKPSQLCAETVSVLIAENVMPYVSRGGLKLKKAIDMFGINMTGEVAMDIGASTGGFTDCMLKNGVSMVYAVDVGSDQLDPELQKDARVISMENTDIRRVQKYDFLDVTFISVDVSFISLALIIPKISELLSQEGRAVCLVKPQFEAGRRNVGKNGLVKKKSVHVSVIKNILNLCTQHGLYACELTFSPIKGGSGNIEYLLYIKKGFLKRDVDVDGVVAAAHRELI